MPARRITSLLGAALLVLGLAACTPDGAAPPRPSAAATGEPIRVTLAVYGPDAVISAYTTIAARFNSENPGISVDIKPYSGRRQELAALARTRGSASAPDIFLASTRDLPRLMQSGSNQRVDAMLSEQNVDFGDGYERAAIEAFSADSALQCMPVDISPLVVYYNRSLVKLETLRTDGRTQPTPDTGWRFDDFTAAAAQASTGAKRGVYVAPDVEQFAPFLFSAGHQLVDSTSDPTQLSLEDSTGTIRNLLELLRDPLLTFTPAQLARKSALSRFKQGQLGMILGFRSLTPELRQQDGLDFGVMPMPRVGRSATITDTTGLCVKPDLRHPTATGRVLAYLVGDQASRVLAATGYVTPANTAVLNSDAFDAPDELPVGSSVFASQIRFTNELPEGPGWRQVQPRLESALSRLVYGSSSLDTLDTRLQGLDQRLSAVLAGASASASASPSPSSSASPSASSSPSG